MSMIRGIIFVLAIVAISSQEVPVPLFDLNSMYEQGTLEGFLAKARAVPNGAPITLEQCLDKPAFQITKMVVDPTEIVKGQNIRIKVGGIMLAEQTVKNLHLETHFNGSVIDVRDVDKKNAVVKKGPYAYDYEAAVPTFTPSGKWEIFVNLFNAANEKISCVKATFVMP